MTDFLARWENFLGIIPLPTDSLSSRQQRISTKLTIVGKAPTFRSTYDLLYTAMPNTFVNIVETPISSAVASIPGGLSGTGNEICANGPWQSTLSNITIQFHQQSWQTDTAFQAEINQVYALLNQFLPSYVSFNVSII